MKLFAVFFIAGAYGHRLSVEPKEIVATIPKKQQDPKKDPEWEAYKAKRGDHDCAINENQNWLGIGRCAYSWECQGARQCSQPDKQENGWCQGDSICPEMGPLDYFDKHGDVKWNLNSGRNYDGFVRSEEEPAVDATLQIANSENEYDTGMSMDQALDEAESE